VRQGGRQRALIDGFFCPWTGRSARGALFLLSARALALALLMTLLAGCSAIRVGYNQADNLLAWMADDYFDLDAVQKQDFRARIDRLLKWHRHEQLPDYARFLTEIRQRGQQPLTPDDAAWIVDGVKARFRAIALQGAPDAAEMLATLTPDNIRALEKQYDKVNQKFMREYKLKGTLDERKRARLERTLKQVRDWAGPLTHAQEERISALNSAIPNADHLRHQDRMRRQKEFLALLGQRQNKAAFAPQVRAWLVDWDKGRAPEYEKAQIEIYDKRVALYLDVDRMLTAQQREHVLRKLQGYIDDIQMLAARRVAQI
jgi:Family of unknown function (DUF6279)